MGRKPIEIDEVTLTFAKHPKPDMPIIESDGKKFLDVTELFTSSEWEGCEGYEIQSIQK